MSRDKLIKLLQATAQLAIDIGRHRDEQYDIQSALFRGDYLDMSEAD